MQLMNHYHAGNYAYDLSRIRKNPSLSKTPPTCQICHVTPAKHVIYGMLGR